MGNVAVEPLDGAIDGLLALHPDTLTDTELHEVVVGLERQAHRLAAARARLTAAWDGRQIWADDGSRSPGHRLAREATMSVAAAKTEVRRALALRTMPATAAALAAGDLSPEHVDVLARANDGARRVLFADHESVLIEQCKRLRFADAVKLVEYWRQRADAESCEDEAERRDDRRSASAARTIDGMVDVQAWLDPFGGAAFKAELDRLERQLYLDEEKSGRIRTASQRRADALVEMAHRSRTAAPDGLRPRPLITVLCGEASFTRICELADGTVVTPGQIVHQLADADIESILFDGPDRVISVSRRRRFAGALRRAIEVRDRHCQHPSGCDEPADRCDVDHIQPHPAGGLTSQENGRLECWPHNRKQHLHDHGGVPRPPRAITPLDEMRARLRSRCLLQKADPDDESDP
jgi:hypothetical protein